MNPYEIEQIEDDACLAEYENWREDEEIYDWLATLGPEDFV